MWITDMEKVLVKNELWKPQKIVILFKVVYE